MRIVYVLNSLGVGGTERQVLALAARMRACGHAVALMVLLPGAEGDLDTDLDVVRLNITKSPAGGLRALRGGSSFLRAFKPDLLHSHNFHGNMLARLLRLVHPKLKLSSTIHNVYEGSWRRMLAYRITDPLASATTAVCTAAAERYIRLKAVPSSKCLVLTNGIDTGDFEPNLQRREATRARMGAENDFIWLAVGRMSEAKAFPNLYQAFGKVWEAVPSSRLWIAGSFSLPQTSDSKYAVLATPPGALDRIQRLGLCHDMPALFDAVDGFVLSSAWEGMPLALGEAMAMSKPCVATDVGGVRELAGDSATIVPSKDSGALASAMLAVMKASGTEREAQGQAARERIFSKFSMDTKASEWESLYRRLLA